MRSKSAELKTKICYTVNDWKRNVGRTPSLKELGDALGVNKSTIYRYLVEMNEDGLIEYDGNSIDTKELNRRRPFLTPVQASRFMIRKAIP